MDTSEAGRKGGNATLKKFGKEHYRRMGRKNLKPDEQVKPDSLYRRDLRAGFRKSLQNAWLKAKTAQSSAHSLISRRRGDSLPDLYVEFVPCTDCGKRSEVYEHREYAKPHIVDPVCLSCNAKRGPAIDSPVKIADRQLPPRSWYRAKGKEHPSIDNPKRLE